MDVWMEGIGSKLGYPEIWTESNSVYIGGGGGAQGFSSLIVTFNRNSIDNFRSEAAVYLLKSGRSSRETLGSRHEKWCNMIGWKKLSAAAAAEFLFLGSA